MNRTVKYISARLSLRQPQVKSLEILAHVLEKVTLSKDPDLEHDLNVIKSMYSTVQDFEHDFPSLCFALATGIGKTRLMGAFISYLYLKSLSRHFFVLAPNLTIYEKLKGDFSPQSQKYVFRGIQELIANPPVIITGENYESGKGVRLDENNFRGQGRLFEDSDTLFINIFNISKINASESIKGTCKSKIARIKRLHETIGESYFEYLSKLPDLVMLMDEAHSYRASAGASAINELKPVLGIELTATPKTTGSKPVVFKNSIYSYSLSEAIKDGYVKEPAVATRKDLKIEKYTSNELESIKLEDGIRNHEYVKEKLLEYSSQYKKMIVKPFVLVVAQDTNHARELRKLIESNDFFESRYKGKVVEVHSNQSGAEKDENIQRLIAIENPNEPTEIVIHVNKLKEGWDVKNLYTIVPLRTSASEILTEQTIGRGLRLPYDFKTDVESVDRLTIIAHDKFQEIVDLANHPDSIIQKKIIIGNGGDVPLEKTQTISVPSRASMELTGAVIGMDNYHQPPTATQSTIESQYHQRIASVALEVAKCYEHMISSNELSKPEIQTQIIEKVLEKIKQELGSLSLDPDIANPVKEVVETVTTSLPDLIIDIPTILLIPSRDVTYGFHDFDLYKLESLNLKPVSEEIQYRNLRTHKSDFLSLNAGRDIKDNLENYVIRKLINHDLVDYEKYSDLLYKLAKQIVGHLKSSLSDEAKVENVLTYRQVEIIDFIVSQLRQHTWKTPTEYQVKMSRGFKILDPFSCTIQKGAKPINFRTIPEVKSEVKNLIFEGFTKCCYPLQKFDSVDGELRFAHILEDDTNVIRWMKPAPRSFQIEYNNGSAYEPDFVVETVEAKYLCESKIASEMKSETVLAKQKAAVLWCERASQSAQENGGKPWYYALIPHNAINSNRSFQGLMKEYTVNKALF